MLNPGLEGKMFEIKCVLSILSVSNWLTIYFKHENYENILNELIHQVLGIMFILIHQQVGWHHIHFLDNFSLSKFLANNRLKAAGMI